LTGTQVLALIRAEIKDSGSTKISDANALLAINKGIRAVNEELILWDASELFGVAVIMPITAADDTLLLPSDFKSQQFIVLERQESSEWKRVGEISPCDDRFLELYKNETGQPAAYKIKGVNLYIRPIPDAVYPYRFILYYYPKLDELMALTESIPLSGVIDDVIVEYLRFWSMLSLEKASNVDSALQGIVKARIYNIVSMRKPTFVEGGSLIETSNWEL